MDIGSVDYKKAFENYLRRGMLIGLSLKQARTTTHYIWRTRKDGKVRPSHAANDGEIVAWDNPPATGHPGEDYGCRCRAVAYEPDVSEFMEISLSNVADTGAEWTSGDFVSHYWFGNGKAVRLREVGHLRKIVDAYMQEVEERLKGQIADVARNNIGRAFSYKFYNKYKMRDVVFSVGKTELGGNFSGTSTPKHGALEVTGTLDFYLDDEFADPTSLGPELLGSTRYDIFDNWNGSLRGLVLKDRSTSKF